jgi:outer membrane protein assembly factor BamB
MTSSPAVFEGKVYFGSIDGKLYALNNETGDPDPDWEPPFPAGGRIYSTPVISNRKIVFIISNGLIHCLDLDDRTGNKDWNLAATSVTDVCLPTKVAVSNGKVFVPTTYGKLYALNIDDGSEIWSYDIYELSGSIPHTPVVADGKVFVTTAPPPWLPGTVIKLYAIDEELNAEGEVVEHWNYTLKAGKAGIISSPPIIADNKIFAAAGGTVLAFNFDGIVEWQMENVGKVYGSPIVDGSTVFLGSSNGNMYAFDYEDTDEDSDEQSWADAWKHNGRLWAKSAGRRRLSRQICPGISLGGIYLGRRL